MLVADSTKLRRAAAVRIAHISQVQTFVTDAPLPRGLQAICQSKGVLVIEAQPGRVEEADELTPEPTVL
jgi:DeoR family glycerol-3-phosphate regulon repressor